MSKNTKTLEELSTGLENALAEIARLKQASAASQAAGDLPTDLPTDAGFRAQFEALLDFKRRYDDGKAPAEGARRERASRAQAAEQARIAAERKSTRDAQRRTQIAELFIENIERGWTEDERRHAWYAQHGVLSVGIRGALSNVPPVPDNYVPTTQQIQRGRAVGKHRTDDRGVPLGSDFPALRLDNDGSVYFSMKSAHGPHDFYRTLGLTSGQRLDDQGREFVHDYVNGQLAPPEPSGLIRRKRVLVARKGATA